MEIYSKVVTPKCFYWGSGKSGIQNQQTRFYHAVATPQKNVRPTVLPAKYVQPRPPRAISPWHGGDIQSHPFRV